MPNYTRCPEMFDAVRDVLVCLQSLDAWGTRCLSGLSLLATFVSGALVMLAAVFDLFSSTRQSFLRGKHSKTVWRA